MPPSYIQTHRIRTIKKPTIMLWELIATVSAGLGAAGIALMLRLLFKRLPRSLIPAAAGLGMLLFQVYSEYTWFQHTRSLLPASTVVVAEFPQTAFYKPWSYYRPQVLKFAAVDRNNTAALPHNPQQLQTHLYLFERRMSAHSWPLLIDCQTRLQANLPAAGQQPDWQQTEYSHRIAEALCSAPS